MTDFARRTGARLAVFLAVGASAIVPLACGGGGDGSATGAPSGSYSSTRVHAAFEHLGMEAVTSSESTSRLTARFTQQGLSFVTAAIKDPSGTVINRYEVLATVFPSVADARAGLPRAVGDKTYLVRRFRNVIVAVTGLTFRPTSLPPGIIAAMKRLSTGAE
jgi:hypothetical protein